MEYYDLVWICMEMYGMLWFSNDGYDFVWILWFLDFCMDISLSNF